MAAVMTGCRHGEDSLTAEDARWLLERSGQLVDVRSPVEFDRDALPGAINLPVDAISWRCRSLRRWRPVILYGNSAAHCHQAARLLAGEGFSRIYYLDTVRNGRPVA